MPGREFPPRSRSRRWAIIAPYTDKKAYNGVAILSKRPMEDVTPRLPGGDGDDHSRYLEAVITGDKGMRAGRLDLCAQRQSLGPDQIRLTSWPGWSGCSAARRRAAGAMKSRWSLMGDYNIIPEDKDAPRSQELAEGRAVPAGVQGGAAADRKSGLYRCLPRAASRSRPIYILGLSSGSWERNNGIRIDHILLSPQAADRLKACGIDKAVRGASEKPSDHVPVWVRAGYLIVLLAAPQSAR